jgi:hypothetical protein
MRISCLLLALAVGSVLVGCQRDEASHASADVEHAPEPPKPSCMSWDGEVCKPVLFKLLADPGTYSGTTIEVMGYGVWGERSLVVYPSVDMACSQSVTAGIELDHAIDVPEAGVQALAKNGVVSVVVSGVFKSDMNGLSGRYIGHLDDAEITQIDFAGSPLRTDPRNLIREPAPGGKPLSDRNSPAACK